MIDTNDRGAGILCHISSLPNKYGIGTMGEEAYCFADFLKSCGVKYWQILPLVQTGFGDSPYQSVCCNSGNPYFIDLQALKEDGLLTESEISACEMPEGNVNYAALYEKRFQALRLAFSRFNVKNKDFTAFVESGEYDGYATYMSLKGKYNCTLESLPEELKKATGPAVQKFKKDCGNEYYFWQFLQFTFKNQWQKLKAYVNSLGIKIIGDIPLYVAYDSSDVWSRPELFQLDEELMPEKVAGVPPDYFSETGQLWGNPLYNWQAMEEDGYAWWVERVKKATELYDVLRIDHFRGLDRYYAIPYGELTAENGEWEQGPKLKLFKAINKALGNVPIIAEDLGVLDDGVIELRKQTGFPGMKIVLFAFDGNEENAYLPHNMESNSVAYTGTHDNDTCLGYLNGMADAEFSEFKSALLAEMKELKRILPHTTRKEAARALVSLTMASPANLAIIPIQDLTVLDNSARMNTPSTAQGNWQFRLTKIPSKHFSSLMRKMVIENKR